MTDTCPSNIIHTALVTTKWQFVQQQNKRLPSLTRYKYLNLFATFQCRNRCLNSQIILAFAHNTIWINANTKLMLIFCIFSMTYSHFKSAWSYVCVYLCAPITLLSVPGKVFMHVLLSRIQPLLESACRPQQSGFTAGRSTVDAILAPRLLSELRTEYDRPLNVG